MIERAYKCRRGGEEDIHTYSYQLLPAKNIVSIDRA